jgi:aminopeptidase 2
MPWIRVIPLQILSVDGTGHSHIDHDVVLREREHFFALDTSRPFKINAGTTGYCEFAQNVKLLSGCRC